MIPDTLQSWLTRFGQEHLLAGFERLTAKQKKDYIKQLEGIDFETVSVLFRNRDQSGVLPAWHKLQAAPRVEFNDEQRAAARQIGEKALRAHEVGVLLVAGGQGTRLSFEKPKGMYPIGPVSKKSLFQLHAEKVLALRRRYDARIPLIIMTSPATHEETVAFFKASKHFGLPAKDVTFFTQGTMPAVDRHTGKILLDAPGRVALSPNGHGGSLTGLAENGLIDKLRGEGVRSLFYHQVDNPMVKVADPEFIGHHVSAKAEVSSKAVPKNTPTDNQGNFAVVDGRCTIIEYSDLPKEVAHRTDKDGNLLLWAASIAVHIFDLEFLEKVTEGELQIPWHIARKKVPYCDEQGKRIQPKTENALKFEMFVFDVLPRAERWTLIPTTRREEFSPVKNATGESSPETAHQAISNLAGDWLEQAGIKVPRGKAGDVSVPLEISPMFALDAEELAGKVSRDLRIERATYLS